LAINCTVNEEKERKEKLKVVENLEPEIASLNN
jgi:hypothetical protein